MNKDLDIKKQLYKKCICFVEERLKIIKKAIDEVQESLTTETKSSAGDKHETGRAMLQLEREKLGQQLASIQTLEQTLKNIRLEIVSKKVNLGSIVYTSKHNYFISISAGELSFNNQIFYAISFSTPIAKVLLSKETGDKIQFGNSTFTITKIV